MEQSGGNQNISPVQLCRNGCGFYAGASFEGMCSKCYKDTVKRKQQNPAPPQTGHSTGRASPIVTSTHEAIAAAASEVLKASTSAAAVDTAITPNVDTATPTVPCPSADQEKAGPSDDTQGAVGGKDPAVADKSKEENEDKDKKPKKNRCHTCKKKVGLTGFPCRCGGLFCSLHRYSDKHECNFNYKELAQEQIRKANPVVVSEKIKKI